MEQTLRTPVSLFYRGYLFLGVALLLHGTPQQALESFAREELDSYRQFGTALALHDLGRPEASKQALDEYLEAVGAGPSWELARVYAWTGHTDAAFEQMQGAAERDRLRADGRVVRWNLQRTSVAVRNPMFRRLRDDPRWHETLTEYGVSSEQLAVASFNPLSAFQLAGGTTAADTR